MFSHPEIVNVSQNVPSRQSPVQIEMAPPQTGLRNRVRQTPDGLAHLNSGGINDRPKDMSNLRSIACALIRLDAWTYQTIEQANYANTVKEDFQAVISKHVQSLKSDGYLYENRFETYIQHILEKLSNDETLEILGDLSTSMYYAQFIKLRMLFFQDIVMQHQYATNPSIISNLTVPKALEQLLKPLWTI